MVVIDPSAKHPTLDVFTTNYPQLAVHLYNVEPRDYDAYRHYVEDQWNHDNSPKPPGTNVFDHVVPTSGGHNQLVETVVDLAPAMKRSGLGHAIVIVEPSPWPHESPPPQLISWVQSTRLAVDAHVDADSLVAVATELGTGKAADGVDVELRPYGIAGKTDDRGIATLALGSRHIKAAHYVVATRGEDTAFVVDESGGNAGSWFKQARGKELAWYVADDHAACTSRASTASASRSWLRLLDSAKGGDIGTIGDAVTSVSYKVTDARNVQIATGSARVTGLGGFDTTFTVPTTPNLGYANIELTANGRLTGSDRSLDPDRGVPAAGVRGHGAGEPGAAVGRRIGRRHGPCEVLRRRAARRCADDVVGEREPDLDVHAAEP